MCLEVTSEMSSVEKGKERFVKHCGKRRPTRQGPVSRTRPLNSLTWTPTRTKTSFWKGDPAGDLGKYLPGAETILPGFRKKEERQAVELCV